MASLAIGGVLLLGMIAASGWAAVTLPPGARIPIHFGSVEHCHWAAKRSGLVIWPVVGALCCGILGGLSASSVASNWVPGLRDVLMPAAMCVVLCFQVGALALARRQGQADVTIRAGGTGAERGTTVRSD